MQSRSVKLHQGRCLLPQPSLATSWSSRGDRGNDPGIFILPSFIFVALVTPWVPKLRRSIWFGSWLDRINARAWGAISVVAYQLGVSTLVNWQSIAIAIDCQFVITLAVEN